MAAKRLLILSCKGDPHVDYMIDKMNLAGLGSQVVRLNTEDILTNAVITIRDQMGEVMIKDSTRSFTTEEIACVWFRRPETPVVPPNYEPDSQDFVISQINTVLNGLYYLTSDSAVWVNPRSTASISSNKIKQMQVAKAVGFDAPATLVTNDTQSAQRFLATYPGVCIKSLDSTNPISAGHKYPFHTAKLTDEEKISHLHLIEHCPTFFQEFIEKSFDLRVTVIGEKVYGVEIHSQERPESKQDFRLVSPRLLEHRVHEVPTALQSQILQFMHSYGLYFSAMDFAVTDDNTYYFLENNPNGQWLWLEDRTGIPISEGFLDFFSRLL